MTAYIFDVMNWKPCTPIEYIDTLALIITTQGKPTVETRLDTFEDYRHRLVTSAYVVRPGRTDKAMTPYLMVMTTGEHAKNVCFRRSDVNLA